MTGQDHFGSYEAWGAHVAVDLVNDLAVEVAFGRPVAELEPFASIRRILEIDPPSAEQLRQSDVPGFVALADRLLSVFSELDRGALDTAAGRVNDLLAAHSAQPHLAKEDGQWRLHHHPVDAALVPMVTAICAEGLARVIGAGDARRLGTCESDDCDRVFLDESKNSSRRFCSLSCQNRVKAAAFPATSHRPRPQGLSARGRQRRQTNPRYSGPDVSTPITWPRLLRSTLKALARITSTLRRSGPFASTAEQHSPVGR